MFTKTRALILTAVALLTACSNVASDNFEGEYMVVAPLPGGDSLNEREAPSAGAKIIDRLMPGTLVTVGERTVTEGTAWRQKAGDGGGWLAESFLKPADFRLIGDTSVPAGGACSGFEPIWSLNWDEKHLTLELGNEIQQYPITQIIKAKGYRDALLVAANKPNYRITLRFEAAPCPYLPVDAFMFGRGTLMIENKDQFAWYLGCCSPTASALSLEQTSQAVSAVTEGSYGPSSTEDFLAGKYALQIASRSSDQEVASLFETISERFQDASDANGLEIFRAQNGWYAIVVVTPSKIACNATRETLVARALIPSDSYCNPGDGYIRRLRIKGGSLLSVYKEKDEPSPALPVDDKSFEEGISALLLADYEKALELLAPLAQQGNAKAQFAMGWMYGEGAGGVRQDDREAVVWYRRSAEQGFANSQLNLGKMYEDGSGVPQDDSEAAAWYRRAAEQGVAGAQFNLGLMYLNGKGLSQDFREAADWFTRAATQGIPDAQYNLGLMYDTGMSMAEDNSEAAAWYRRAAEQENAWAQLNLGIMYINGDGLPQSTQEGLAWVSRAADKGFTRAQRYLEAMFAESPAYQMNSSGCPGNMWRTGTGCGYGYVIGAGR